MRKINPTTTTSVLLTIFLFSLFALTAADESENTCIDSAKYIICDNVNCPCPYTENSNPYFQTLKIISPSFTLLLILGFLLARNLRQQPGDFFLGFAVGEMALFIISNLEIYENNKPKNISGINTSESFCFAIGASRIFFRRAIRLYHICFMIYYLRSLQSSLKASKVSTTLYHVIPWLTASCLLMIEINKGTVGKAIVGTCGLRSSSEPSRFTVDFILCVICVIVTGLLIARFSSRYKNLGPATKKQIRYYLSYFIFANLFLIIPFASKAYSAYKLNDYFNSQSEEDISENIQGAFLAEHYSVIYIDMCSPIILTLIRLFDPSIGKNWLQLFRKILCCGCFRRSSRKQSDTNYYFELNDNESRSIMLSLKANEISNLMEKSSFIDQVQYKSRVQVVYSLLAAIHYNLKSHPGRKSSGRSGPKDDAYYNRKAKTTNKHLISDQVIEETLPEVMEEVRAKNHTIIPGRLTVYAPEVFEEITRLDGIESNLIDSLDLKKNFTRILKSGNADGGRSGEFFFFSNDNRLIIKTISTEELNVLLGILPRFLKHFQRNPNSLIAKIYAAFTFEVKNPYEKYHLILMKNINGYPSPCVERKYDLKGATVDRSVLRNAEMRRSLLKFHGTMKDIDFDKHEEKLNISEEAQNSLLDTIVRDVSFLRMEALIDYSLAVYLVNKGKLSFRQEGSGTSLDSTLYPDGEKSPVNEGNLEIAHPVLSIKSTKEELYYHLGIIDYLTKYGWKKRSEKFLKQLRAFNWKLDTSCQDPHTYNRRFLGYMEKIILEDYVKEAAANQSILL